MFHPSRGAEATLSACDRLGSGRWTLGGAGEGHRSERMILAGAASVERIKKGPGRSRGLNEALCFKAQPRSPLRSWTGGIGGCCSESAVQREVEAQSLVSVTVWPCCNAVA